MYGLGRQDRGRPPGQRVRRQLLGVPVDGTSPRWHPPGDRRAGAASRELPAADIAADLRQGADHRLSPPVTGPLSGLTDVLVHGGDIRIPLGIPFDPDPQLASLALDFLTGGGLWLSSRLEASRDLSAGFRRRPMLGEGRRSPRPRQGIDDGGLRPRCAAAPTRRAGSALLGIG